MRLKTHRIFLFMFLFLLTVITTGCNNDDISKGIEKSNKIQKLSKKIINAKQKDFENIDAEFDTLTNEEKNNVLLESRKEIYLKKSRSENQNDDVIISLINTYKEYNMSIRNYEPLFIGDLTESELKKLYSMNKENSKKKLLKSGCKLRNFPTWLPMNNSYSSNGQKPNGFSRVINNIGESPCDYEVKFPIVPSKISTNSWFTYRLLRGFGGGVHRNNNRAIFGFWRTQIWIGGPEWFVSWHLKSTLFVK